MNSFKFISAFIFFSLMILSVSCRKDEFKIVTVTGEIPVSRMGITLPHEHVLFDLTMIDSIGIHKYNKDSVIQRMLPLLSLIHISEPTRRTPISYAVFCLKKK